MYVRMCACGKCLDVGQGWVPNCCVVCVCVEGMGVVVLSVCVCWDVGVLVVVYPWLFCTCGCMLDSPQMSILYFNNISKTGGFSLTTMADESTYFKPEKKKT